MRKKKFVLTACLLTFTLALVIGCGSPAKTSTSPAAPAASTPTPAEEPAKVEPIQKVNLVEQVKNSGHAKIFPTMVGMGPDVKKNETEHYGDGCLRCHSAVKILDDPNAVLDDFFPGGKYAGQTEGISCRVCHTFEGAEMIGLRYQGWETCGSCHVNSGGDPKLGSEVHHPQYQMIKGVAIGDLPTIPSYKYANMKDSFACQDCHITNGFDHDFMVPGVKANYSDAAKIKRSGTSMDYSAFKEIFNQEDCVSCHADPTKTIDKIKAHQEEISKKLEELKPTYEEWSKKAASITDKNDPKLLAFQQGATFFTFVEADASKGAHNYNYSKAALEKAQLLWSILK